MRAECSESDCKKASEAATRKKTVFIQSAVVYLPVDCAKAETFVAKCARFTCAA